MTRRIKPVTRASNKETEVKRTRGVFPVSRRILPRLGEVAAPAVDILEKAEEILVEIELPGVPDKDIKILLYPNRVEVSGIKRGSPLVEGVRYHRLEREFGAFRREVFVPRAIDPDRTFARLANGVLIVVLRKRAGKAKDPDSGKQNRE